MVCDYQNVNIVRAVLLSRTQVWRMTESRTSTYVVNVK